MVWTNWHNTDPPQPIKRARIIFKKRDDAIPIHCTHQEPTLVGSLCDTCSVYSKKCSLSKSLWVGRGCFVLVCLHVHVFVVYNLWVRMYMFLRVHPYLFEVRVQKQPVSMCMCVYVCMCVCVKYSSNSESRGVCVCICVHVRWFVYLIIFVYVRIRACMYSDVAIQRGMSG